MVRIGPSGDRFGILVSAADMLWTREADKDAPGSWCWRATYAQSQEAARRLKRADTRRVATRGLGGGTFWDCVVVGTMSAAYAPLERLVAAVVLDAHDEAYHAEAAPTWCAWELVAERARRRSVPRWRSCPRAPRSMCSRAGRLVVTDRVSERRAWPRVEVVDRRGDDPRTGLFSERVVRLVRWAAEKGTGSPDPGGEESGSARMRRVVCVLNTTGRARLLACGTCKALVRCERCKGPLSQPQSQPAGASQALTCRRCDLERPFICAECGSARLIVLRQGVSRVREELEALSGTAVTEVWGAPGRHQRAGVQVADSVGGTDGRAATQSQSTGPESTRPESTESQLSRVVVGTEAVLHRVDRADAVVFLDFDSELMAPRLRAAEEALALLALAARLVSRSSWRPDRVPGGPIVVQTRIPDHPAIASALHADPTLLADEELQVRTMLNLPPLSALARLSGAVAGAYGEALRASAPDSVTVVGPDEGQWRVVAPDHKGLCDLLASVSRPLGRLRVEVDPVRA